jgi:hypothetical protein
MDDYVFCRTDVFPYADNGGAIFLNLGFCVTQTFRAAQVIEPFGSDRLPIHPFNLLKKLTGRTLKHNPKKFATFSR